MPIHREGSGWQWGSHGHVYSSRKGAERQAAAAHAHGYTGDMDRQEFDTLKGLLAKFFGEEEGEQEHAEDAVTNAAGCALVTPDGEMLFLKRGDAGDHPGEWCLPGGGAEDDEEPHDTARRELEEETGFKGGRLHPVDRRDSDGVNYMTFLHPVEAKFDPRLNDEHVDFKWARPEDAPQPLHPGVKATLADDASQTALSARIKREVNRGHDPKQAAAIAYKELGEDEKFAFDRASARRYDEDGRMHVDPTNISKANVCGYLGREIPGYDKLGLDPEKMYQLYRDPEELEKAASTFNNLPVLNKHIPVTADSYPSDLVIGSTGTDSQFKHPYLKNSIVLWPSDAIKDVENGTKKELSSAYRYDADMTPGVTPEGEKFDGRMRNIRGNHVAVVENGRAGSDVVVGDNSLPTLMEIMNMQTQPVLSRKATYAAGALAVFLRPKLATDAKLDFLPGLLSSVSAKNFADKKPTLIAGITDALKGKLAKDMALDALPGMVDEIEKAQVPEGHDLDPNSGLPMSAEEMHKKTMDAEEDDESTRFLKSKLSAEDWAAYDNLRHRGHDAEPETEEERRRRETAAHDAEEKEKDMVTKPAMDAALKATREAAIKETKAELNAIREAEKFVHPWVGSIAIACDSAIDVYKTALKAMAVDGADEVNDVVALKAMIKVQPLPGSKKASSDELAQDSGVVSDYHKMFPGAARIVTA